MITGCAEVVTNTWDCDDSDASEPQVVDIYNAGTTQDGTLSYPYDTIQEGIDMARLCVAVYPGNYPENVDFAGQNIEVFSTGNAKNTIIDGGGNGSTVTFNTSETAAAELRGFTITAGSGTMEETSSSAACDSSGTCVTNYIRYYGGGIFIDGATPTLRGLLISGNSLPAYSYTEVSATVDTYVYSYGGGMFVNHSTGMDMIDVSFVVNTADNGGGLYVGDAAQLSIGQSRFAYNSAATGGGVSDAGGALDLSNIIFTGNAATSGGGAANIDDGEMTWWNVTAVANAGPSGSGVTVMGTGTFGFFSSIIAHNDGGAGIYLESTSASLAAEYSDVYDNAGGNFTGVTPPTGVTGNVEADPDFVNYTDDATDNDDFNLNSTSPLVDAGNPSASYDDADGTVNDMGAYGGPAGSGW